MKYIDTPKGLVGFPDDMDNAAIEKALFEQFTPAPTLVGAGIEGLKGDVRTGASRLFQAAGWPEWAKAAKEDAELNYATQARRPIQSLDESVLGGIYEGVASSLPSMAPVMAGGAAGAVAGAPLGPLGVAGGALAGGVAGALPQFFGSNLKRQQEEQKIPLEQTEIGPAALTAFGQAGLDSALNLLLPGVGKALKAGLFTRAAIRGAEGAGVEALTESAQQWLEVLQANPEKAWEMPKEVQKELLHAAILGGVMGGGVGAASGAIQKAAKAPPPAELEVTPPQLALPPPALVTPPPVTPDNVFTPTPYGGVGTARNPDQAIPPATPPMLALPPPAAVTPPPVTPENVFTPTPYGGVGTARSPEGINPEPAPETPPPSEPTPEVSAPKKTATRKKKADPTLGQRVYDDVFQQQLAAGVKGPEAIANAKLARARYERLAEIKGTDPWTEWKSSNISIRREGADNLAQGTTLNQEVVGHRSVLQKALSNPPMKSGTSQQWLNLLKKNGVKDEELEWTGLKETLESTPNHRWSSDDVRNLPLWYDVEKVAAPAAKLAETDYSQYTLGGFGQKPESNYRDVVLTEGSTPMRGMDPGDYGYVSAHWPDVQNPIAHYRTTDRATPDGKSILLTEEIQSDWHQSGQERGYRGTAEEVDKATAAIDKAKNDLVIKIMTEGFPGVDGMNHTMPRDGRHAETLSRILLGAYRSALRDGKDVSDFPMKDEVEWLDQKDKERFRFTSGVARAPFKDTWPNLAFRHALLDAIEQDKDYVAWTTGEQNTDRYWPKDDPEYQKKLEGMQAFYDQRLVNYANKLGKQFGTKVEKINIGTQSDEIIKDNEAALAGYIKAMDRLLEKNPGIKEEYAQWQEWDGPNDPPGRTWTPELEEYEHLNEMIDWIQARIDVRKKEAAETVHALPITPKLREWAASNPFALFNKTPAAKSPTYKSVLAGYARFNSDGSNLQKKIELVLTKHRTPGTVMHEFAHIWLEEMRRDAASNREIAQDLKVLMDWWGIKDPRKITRAHHEKFARAMEKYLYEGKAPTPSLKNVFERFRLWLSKIIQNLNMDPDFKAKLRPEVRDVLARMLGAERVTVDPKTKLAPGPLGKGPLRGGHFLQEGGTPHLIARSRKKQNLNQPAVGDKTNTPEFKKWFGNSAVVDTDGNPQIVYTGTSKDTDFKKFNVPAHGAWFTTDPEVASNYATENDSQRYKFQNGQYEKTNDKPRVIPAFLSIQKPYKWSAADQQEMNRISGDSPMGYRKGQKQMFDRLRAQGYDGVDMGGGTWVLLKDPAKIKSPFNAGKFSQENDNILANQVQAVAPTFYERLEKSSAGKVWANLTNPLRNLPNQREYMINRMRTQGKSDEISKNAEKLAEQIKTDDPKVQKEVYDYLTTRGANPSMISDPKLRVPAKNIKDTVNNISRDLVQAGKLSVTSAAHFHDQYLPRLYLKFLMEKKGMKASGIKVGDEGYLKQRKALTADEKKALGEIKDPAFLAYVAMTRPQRDLAVADMMTELTKHPEWVWQASLVNYKGKMVTPYWLKDEAVNIRERMALEPDPKTKQDMERIASEMEATAAQNNPNADEYNPKEFTRIPNTASYGPMRGAVVRTEIADDIKGMEQFIDPNNFMERWFGDRGSKLVKANQFWKEAKVVWNLPTQVRNFVSNMMLLHLSGVPAYRIPGLVYKAAKEINDNGKHWQVAKKYGIASSTMTETELRKSTDKFLKNLETANHGKIRGSLAPILKAGATLREFAQESYQFTEYLGKTMKIIDEMERNGKSEADAALEANKWLFDYSLVSPSVRYLRNAPLGMPFVTFTTKVLPLLVESALTPKGIIRLGMYYALSQMLPALVASMNDIEEDDIETLRKAMSERLRKRGDMYLLPWKDEHGRWQFMDVGYFLPWQQFVDSGRALARGEPGEAARSIGVMTGFVPTAIAALTTGVDTFTNQPIANKFDPPRQQAWDWVNFLWGMAAPPTFTQYGAIGRYLRADSGSGVNRHGEPNEDMNQLIARSLGMNINPVMPESSRARNLLSMQYEIEEQKRRMNTTLRDQSLTDAQRRRIIEDFRVDLMRRYAKMQEYIKESEMSPALKAATARKD